MVAEAGMHDCMHSPRMLDYPCPHPPPSPPTVLERQELSHRQRQGAKLLGGDGPAGGEVGAGEAGRRGWG